MYSPVLSLNTDHKALVVWDLYVVDENIDAAQRLQFSEKVENKNIANSPLQVLIIMIYVGI